MRCFLCGRATSMWIERDEIGDPYSGVHWVCFHCYQSACIEAVAGRWPSYILQVPGAAAPFTNEARWLPA